LTIDDGDQLGGPAATRGAPIHKPDWARYFDELTRRLEKTLDLEASVEIVGADAVGTEAEWLPLLSVTYERGDEEIAIGLGGRERRHPAALWHYVERPQLIWVHEHDGVPTAIGLGDDEGTLTLLRMRSAQA
jgi:hypothetical protein